MFNLSRQIVLFSSLLFFFSCSRNYNSTPPVTAESELLTSENYSSESNSQPEKIFTQDPGYQRFFVPPEIAYLQATIYARGNSFTEVANTVSSNSQKVLEGIDRVEGCSAVLLDYNHPQKITNKKIITGDAIYASNSVLELTISLAEIDNMPARIDRVNQCILAIPQVKLANPQQKNSLINISLSRAIPTVKDVNLYREQLLANKFARLKSIANISDMPTQFNFAKTQCTSNGLVKIGERSLSRIELEIDFKCQQFDK